MTTRAPIAPAAAPLSPVFPLRHHSSSYTRRRTGQFHLRMLIFLVAFVAILLLASYGFLFPALRAAEHATPSQKRELTAYAALVLMLVLVCLVVILIVTFRVGQYFFPRHREPPTRTEPFDAWAESARRLQLKDDSDLDDPDDDQNDPDADNPDIPP